MKDLFAHSKNIVECLLYARLYDRCEMYSRGERAQAHPQSGLELLRETYTGRDLELARGGCHRQ